MSVYKGILDLDIDVTDEEYARNMLDGRWEFFFFLLNTFEDYKFLYCR